jgi:hypothetical protein
MNLQVHFTHTFVENYEAVPQSDLPGVNQMLDRLERHHARPEMRHILRIGDVSVFATPRIHAPGGVYRITWRYDDRDRPTVIVCITVASIET